MGTRNGLSRSFGRGNLDYVGTRNPGCIRLRGMGGRPIFVGTPRSGCLCRQLDRCDARILAPRGTNVHVLPSTEFVDGEFDGLAFGVSCDLLDCGFLLRVARLSSKPGKRFGVDLIWTLVDPLDDTSGDLVHFDSAGWPNDGDLAKPSPMASCVLHSPPAFRHDDHSSPEFRLRSLGSRRLLSRNTDALLGIRRTCDQPSVIPCEVLFLRVGRSAQNGFVKPSLAQLTPARR